MENKDQIKSQVLSFVILGIIIWMIYLLITQKRGVEQILSTYQFELNRSYDGVLIKNTIIMRITIAQLSFF